MKRANPATVLVDRAVAGYVGVVLVLWAILLTLVDKAWPATLFGYGPRWVAGLPLVPLATAVCLTAPRHRGLRLAALLLVAASVLVVGILDFRFARHRTAGPPHVRLFIQNLGESHVTAESLDRLLHQEQVDVAVLQECPFYDNAPARLGWRFYYGGDLCLASHFPFTLLDVADPDNAWRDPSRRPMRYRVTAPIGEFQIVNVHFETIRTGLEALAFRRGLGLPVLMRNREEATRDSVAAREIARRVAGPLVVAGDFNMPVESAIYRANWGEFTNVFSACGYGFGQTKHEAYFGLRIDHVLTTTDWSCTDARVISSPYGGDHHPLIVDLQLRPPH